MFTSDFAEDFSGLSQKQIRSLEKAGALTPIREHGCKYYNYTDICILKTAKILKRNGIKPSTIKNALEYLQDLDIQQPLTSFILLHDRQSVYALLENRKVNASKWGQMVLDGTIETIALGSELEHTRQAMRNYVSEMSRRINDKSPQKVVQYSPEKLKKLMA